MADDPIPSESTPIFPDDDLLNNVISSFSSSSEENDVVLPLNDVVFFRYPSPTIPVSPNNNKKQIDDSRKLFQRLWTDEDEIQLLQGFLNYTISRGNVHHHDSTAFYDQIKNNFQLHFNKNQLVEKLRRLKKKCRIVLAKINSGKQFLFKSSHDQATFELSRKIWFNLGANYRDVVEIDDGNQNPNPNFNSSSVGGGGLEKLSTRKRQKVVEKVEEGGSIINNDNSNNNNNGSVSDNDYDNVMNNNIVNNVVTNVGVSSPLQGLVEETLRNCVSSVLKEVINNVVNDATPTNGSVSVIGEGGNVKGKMDEKWRKQQILELEAYSRRLELVQDQIKVTLEELRSMES